MELSAAEATLLGLLEEGAQRPVGRHTRYRFVGATECLGQKTDFPPMFFVYRSTNHRISIFIPVKGAPGCSRNQCNAP